MLPVVICKGQLSNDASFGSHYVLYNLSSSFMKHNRLWIKLNFVQFTYGPHLPKVKFCALIQTPTNCHLSV